MKVNFDDVWLTELFRAANLCDADSVERVGYPGSIKMWHVSSLDIFRALKIKCAATGEQVWDAPDFQR